MQSQALTVDGYLDDLEPTWRATLERMRDACRSHLIGCEEVFAYGMPTYRQSGKSVVGFAKQARYLSLYVLKQDVLDRYRPSLDGLDVGKGCVRYRRPDQIDWEVVGQMLDASVASPADPC